MEATFHVENAHVREQGIFAFGRSRIASVRATAEAIEIGDRSIPRAEIESALIVPSRDGATVRLRRQRGRMTEIDVPDVEVAGDLLRTLALDAERTPAAFKVANSIFSGGGLMLALPLAFLASIMVAAFLGKLIGMPAMLLPLVTFGACLTVVLSPATLKVGADGVLFEWMMRRRFVPYAEIDDVSVVTRPGPNGSQQSVVQLKRGASTVDIAPSVSGAVPHFAETIAQRIRDASTPVRETDHVGSLAQEGRSPRDWIAHLKRVGTGAAAGLRTAAVPTARLLGLLEDVSQPRRVRLAAAIAIRASDDPNAKTRILEVANAAASPKLRIALEAAADSAHDEELEAIVADVDDASDEDSALV